MAQLPYRILCVCLGNICRSPTAEVILREYAVKAGWHVSVDSAGTSNYHPGKAPDSRSQRHAKVAGYDLSALRARQIRAEDFEHFDLILAMDHENLRDLQGHQHQLKQAGQTIHARLALMSEYDLTYLKQAVPDPYYGEQADFERVIAQCESSAQAWIDYWQSQPDMQRFLAKSN
jgi:protein-tyrosine phosphatase